uniref:Uncharacterized protein n=1 Tax=Tetranychus urticae TaxID=32264 RepID=T1L2P7_TETUR
MSLSKEVRRELQAVRNNWICAQGSTVKIELFIYPPNDLADKSARNLRLCFDPIIREFPHIETKVSYVLYRPSKITVGCFKKRGRSDLAAYFHRKIPSWSYVAPQQRQAQLYFFTQEVITNNSHQFITNNIIQGNDLTADRSTQVVSVTSAFPDKEYWTTKEELCSLERAAMPTIILA